MLTNKDCDSEVPDFKLGSSIDYRATLFDLGGIAPLDAYLVLSGSRVRNTIRLLRDFGVHIVNNAPFRPEAATSSHARRRRKTSPL